MALGEFEKNASSAIQETTLGQRIIRGGIGLSLLTAIVTGLGYMQERANEKIDAQRRESMSAEQMETLLEAARSDTCELVHPYFQRICAAEQEALEAEQDTPSL